MASLEKRNQTYRIVFMYDGRKRGFSLATSDRKEAESLAGGVEKLLMRLEQKLIKLPPDVDIVDFVKNDGQVDARTVGAPPEAISLAQLRDRYLEAHGSGALEANSLGTIRIHLAHIGRSLGEGFAMQTLKASHLQGHVTRRARDKGVRGQKLSTATIRKELASLRAAWNWAAHMGLVSGVFPNRGLVFPKSEEKPPFMTWAEIERRIAVGGVSEKEKRVLWDALFLTLPEIGELLGYVECASATSWVHPMFVFAAHTGARRSEMLRAYQADVDFTGGTVLIREKKRKRGKSTTRRVPLTPVLSQVLQKWLQVHPGGPTLFCQPAEVPRSRTKRDKPTGITRDEVHDQFKRALAGSKWEAIRGWHVLRHSFASNCAARGVDQRLIDSWLGHTTEIRKRYLHLIPSNESAALNSVFDSK